MKAIFLATLCVLGGASLWGQTPAATPTAQPHTAAIGFTYALPSDWEVLDMQPSLPAVKQEIEKSATSEGEKEGAACVQVALTARHGDPASMVVVVDLPFDCFGQTLTDKDLAGFGQGASEGVKKSLTISNPEYDAYTLGTHSMWIERANGALIDHPETKYSFEIVCSVLKKGAVCWMSMAQDDAAMQTFEHGAVSLDGEAPAALVPASVFKTKAKP
jgi:hypothetical protein